MIVSGAGNVATYAIQKAWQLGGKPVTCSDSTGWVYDPEGIDVEALKEIKEVKRARLTEYKNYRPNSEYHEGRGVWTIKADIALPCATQNELNLDDAKTLVANGVKVVAEGANMPTTQEATDYLQANGVVFLPGKAPPALFGRVKNEGRCLVDRCCQCAAGILFVIAVYNKRRFLIRVTHKKLLPIKGLQKPISADSWLLPRRIWALQD